MSTVIWMFIAAAGGFALAWALRTMQLRRTNQEFPPDDQTQLMVDRFQAVLKTGGFTPWEIDATTGKFIWAENRIEAFGLSKLSLDDYGDALTRMMHPDDRNELTGIIERALAGNESRYSYRYRLMRPDGLVRHMQTHVHIVRDEKGRAARLLGSTTDVTNEVQTQELLQRQAEQERQLLDRLNIATQAAGISSWEIDLEARRFLWIEKHIEGMLEPEDDSLEAFARLLHPDDRDLFVEALADGIRGRKERLTYRYRALTSENRIIHVQVNARLVRNELGRVHRLLGVSWDITREVEAAERVEAQAAHERMLLDRLSIATQAADISSWQLDVVTRKFLWVENPIAALKPDDLTDHSFSSLTDRALPQDEHTAADAIARAIASGSDRASFRYRGIGRDGRIVHIQNYAKLLVNEAGTLTSLLGVSWDITREVEAAEQLEQQAQQLRDAERRIQHASLSSSEGHWESVLDTKTIWTSSSYHALLGYAAGELPTDVDEFTRRIVHPDDANASREALLRHNREAAPFAVDHRMRTAAGEYRWIRTRGSIERNADGRITTMAGSIQDIHEQKLAEDALREAQKRFQRAIAGTQDGLWETDADGTAWSSPRLCQLLGYDPVEFPEHRNFLRDSLHPEDVERVVEATRAHLDLGQPYDVEIRLLMRDGTYRWFRARASAEKDADGRAQRFSGSLQDVTEARAAREELLRATQAAEAANRAKSEFLANVSHEIRTPMNGIIGMTGLLLETTLDRTQRDYAETIRGSADSLLIVINDILDFSKIEAGKLDIEAIEMDLRSNVEDVGGVMAFQAAARNLELVVHVHPEVPAHVVGDPQRLRQCLINLVGNAVKFTRQGEIVIEVSLAGHRDGKALVQFEVRDTGIGIAPETLNSLFQPFVQADSSTTRHFGGTGLGLSIVRRLVEMMGGEVGVASEPGKGSVFWFVLPMEVGRQTLTVPIDLTRLGRRILVVDDQETNRRVLAGQLLHTGYEASLAGSGDEALRLMRIALSDGHPFEVVIVDYRMQDMDGAALGERINQDPELSQARVIVLTSLDRHGDMQRFASLGFAGYLTKPVRARELFECLDRVLARNAREWHMRSQPIVTRGSLTGNEGSRRFQGSVLLVEDNAVNQKVAVRFLERMGCKVRVADNGADGVKAWQESRFDIVLMDLQMPVMDGLTATRRIRELERDRPGRTTPIVALTANAMSGQLERCLDAGMNGFLTKPLDIARLHEALDRYGLGRLPDTAPATGPAPVLADSVPVELGRLHELTAGDAEFAHELAVTFVASGEQVLKEIHTALENLDRVLLARAAHKLKGASANIYAEPLRALAADLETNGPGLDQPRLRDLVLGIDLEFQRAAQFLQGQAGAPANRPTGQLAAG
ncbi:PAS domain-containing protein [Povalibacter sp.]|uniref:PAS domain-containing protein n=1 Tax=Povalibacter sp. TaxID=1962978 RepID=UPI002F42E682